MTRSKSSDSQRGDAWGAFIFKDSPRLSEPEDTFKMTKLTKKDIIPNDDNCKQGICSHRQFVELSRLVEAREALKKTKHCHFHYHNDCGFKTSRCVAVVDVSEVDEFFLGEQK